MLTALTQHLPLIISAIGAVAFLAMVLRATRIMDREDERLVRSAEQADDDEAKAEADYADATTEARLQREAEARLAEEPEQESDLEMDRRLAGD